MTDLNTVGADLDVGVTEHDFESDLMKITVAVDHEVTLSWILTTEQAILLVSRVARAARVNP